MDYKNMPIINWKALATVNRPNFMAPPPGAVPGENMWDRGAANYNRMAKLEAEATTGILNCFETLPTDSVLDCGCGPGRITVQMAAKAAKVTAMDSAPKMLQFCKDNCAEAGHTNVTFKDLDFFSEEFENGFDEQFDVVICSRSAGLTDIERLAKLSKRLVVLQGFANSPSLPETFSKLFKGCAAEPKHPMMGMNRDRRLDYNIFFNQIYDMGYEPSLRVMPDYFKGVFDTKEAAYEYLLPLGKVDDDKMDVFHANVDEYLTQNEDGSYTFRIDTRASVIWFEVNPRKFF